MLGHLRHISHVVEFVDEDWRTVQLFVYSQVHVWQIDAGLVTHAHASYNVKAAKITVARYDLQLPGTFASVHVLQVFRPKYLSVRGADALACWALWGLRFARRRGVLMIQKFIIKFQPCHQCP